MGLIRIAGYGGPVAIPQSESLSRLFSIDNPGKRVAVGNYISSLNPN